MLHEELIPDYLKHKVLIGLRPASVDVYDAPGSKVANNCPGSATSFAQHVQYASDLGLTIAFGSDFNTGALGAYGVCVCDGDNDCSANNWCNAGLDLKQNKCEALKQDTDSCPAVGGGHACASGTCNLDRCYTANSVPLGGTCYLDAACKQGKCSAIDGAKGTCVCKEDVDCGAGKWCDAGLNFKKNTCKNQLNLGEQCGTVGELSVGHRCKSGDCKVAGLSTKLKCK